MLRLAHRIIAARTTRQIALLAGCYDDDIQQTATNMFDDFATEVASATCFVVDNVADYYYSSAQDIWHIEKDFPSCAPCFNSIFVEWKESSNIFMEGEWHKQTVPGTIGALMSTVSIDELRTTSQSTDLISSLASIDNAKHLTRFMFVQQSHGRLCFHGAIVVLPYDKHWTPIQPLIVACLGADRCSPEYQSIAQYTVGGTFIHVPLLAMSFANCKGVVRIVAGKDCEPDKPWARKHNAPQIRYHLLNINPMKEVLRTEGQSETTGLQKALHICRGHFKTYTEDRPLFGKYSGTFWHPQSVRGKAERGLVLKDYSVSTGR